MNNLSELFKQIRLSKDWSIRQAAKKMGLSHSYLSTLEKGIDRRTGKDSTPRPDTLKLIAKAYDYPYEELLKAAGYLGQEKSATREFNFSSFVNNIKLIMSNMSLEELSKDILDKTGYSIDSKQIRGYLNGDIEPFPGTINILNKYAEVSTDFWYRHNTMDDWNEEKKIFSEKSIIDSPEEFSPDFLLFSSIREDIKKWLSSEDSIPYIKIAMQAQQNKINVNSLKTFIESIVMDRVEK